MDNQGKPHTNPTHPSGTDMPNAQAYHSEILDLISDGYFVLDNELVVTQFNRESERLLGRNREDVIGRPLFEAFPEAKGSIFEDYYTLAVREKQALAFETYFGVPPYENWYDVRVFPHAQGISIFFQVTTARKQAEEALRFSQATLSGILLAAPTGIGLVVDRVIKWVNGQVCHITGYSRAELVEHNARILYPDEEEFQHVGTVKYALIVQHGTGTVETRWKRKDGRVIDVLLSSTALDTNDLSLGVTFAVLDITDRKRAEQALRESEEKYRFLVENAEDMIVVVQDDGLKYVNAKAVELSGLTEEELLATPFIELIHQDDREMIRQRHVSRFKGEPVPERATFRFVRKDGEVRWGESNSVTVTWLGRPAVLSIMSDITDKRRAEEERMTLVTAIEQAAETIMVTDPLGTIVYVNPAFERTTGYRKDETIGQRPSILKSGQHDGQFYREIWETISTGNVWRGSFINRRKDGSVMHEEATISPVTDVSDRIINYVAVKRDVSQEMLLRQQLLQAQKMEAVGTLAGGIAHDFNNLIQIIQGYADIALFDVAAGQPGHAEFQEIKQAARTAAELTQGLLAFSRKVKSDLRPVNVNHELQQVAKMLGRTIPKMIEIELNLMNDLDKVNADPAQIQQVVMNLAVNARDAMPHGGKLTIQTRNVELDADYCKLHLGTSPGRYVMIEMSDNGSGMTKNVMNHIFDPFYTTKEHGHGTGLGLSIAFGIVKNHDGHMFCYSEPGQGTTFKIYLPAALKPQEHDDTQETQTPPGGTETILLVDDEEAVRDVGTKILGRFGYTVKTASNGRTAVELFAGETTSISLVILDLIMPEMSGTDCLRELMRVSPNVKVLIASGYSANGQIDEAIRSGAKAFIRKPFEARQMLELVREVLDEPKDHTP